MNNQDWIKTTPRFVAFFDIMGFKDMVQRNSHNDILEKLEILKNTLKTLEGWNSENIKELEKLNIEKQQTKSITFSDSIIIFSKGESIKDLNKILIDSYLILNKALNSGIGIKGALSYGEITVDFENHLFFGQPIIDAFQLHDELLLYSAVLDNNIESKILTLGEHNMPENTIINFKAILKSGKIKHKLIRYDLDTEKAILQLEKLYQSVSGRPRLYIDNTIDFFTETKKDK